MRRVYQNTLTTIQERTHEQQHPVSLEHCVYIYQSTLASHQQLWQQDHPAPNAGARDLAALPPPEISNHMPNIEASATTYRDAALRWPWHVAAPDVSM